MVMGRRGGHHGDAARPDLIQQQRACEAKSLFFKSKTAQM